MWHTWQTTPGGAWNGAWNLLYRSADRFRSLDVGANQDGRLEVIGISADERIWRTRQILPGRWEDQDPAPISPAPQIPAIRYTDAHGYHYDETSVWWKELCTAFPCFAQLQWPDYASTVVEDIIDGQAVVIQLWKGWCPKFL